MEWSDLLIYGVYGSIVFLGLALSGWTTRRKHNWHEVSSTRVAQLTRKSKGKK